MSSCAAHPTCTCMGHWTVRPGWKAVGVNSYGTPVLEAPIGTPLPAYVWTVEISDPACVIHYTEAGS